MQSKREILQKALENINHPLSEITRRTTYRGHSPGVKPTTGIKLNLPKTSTMAAKMEKVLADKSPEGRKRMKQMNNLVIGREEDGDKISLEFKTTASRERFRKMMNELSENVQLDEGSEITFSFDNPMKAGAFASRIMRDKLASEVDRYVSGRKEMVQVIMHPNDYERNDIEKLAKQYKGQLREDLQLDETNFRFPQPGEDYGEFGMSINDPDSFSGSGMSLAQGKKKSAEIQRKFAVLMRKHKRTKVGEVLDLLAKDGKIKVHQDSDIKLIKRYLTKHKDNVRKVAHQMMIDFMEGDDYLAKKRIPVTEGRMQDAAKKLPYNTKKLLAKQLNRMNLGGYGDYEARVDNVHKFKDTDLAKALQLVHPAAVSMALKEAESLKWTGMKDTEKEELVRLAKVPARVTEMKWKEIPNPLKERLAKYINKSTKGEFALVEVKSNTIVVDRKTGKIVYGPTDAADAKLFVKKQIQPRKFVIRQER